MKPHEQRVIDEKHDLLDRLTKLNAFIATEVFAGLAEIDRILMRYQRDQMAGYLDTLRSRIERF